MDAYFSPLVVETHGRFNAGFVTLLKRLATQLDGGQGLTAREAVLLKPGPDQGQGCTRSKSEKQSLDGVSQEEREKRPTGRLIAS